jgi:hypothetical protein
MIELSGAIGQSNPKHQYPLVGLILDLVEKGE